MREQPYAAALRHKVLSKEQEHELCTRYAALKAEHGAEHPKAIATRNQLVCANLRSVAKMALRYKRLPFEDLMSEGVKGLIIGVERFEVDRGWRLGTYAQHWIRHALQRASQNLAGAVRVPVHEQEKLRSGVKERDGVKLGDATALSLDAPLNQEGKHSLHDLLASDATSVPDEMIDLQLSEDVRRAVLSVLTPREREIIESRYLRAKEETLSEVGERMVPLHGNSGAGRAGTNGGLSRERIRQLETLAFAKLRRALAQYAPIQTATREAAE